MGLKATALPPGSGLSSEYLDGRGIYTVPATGGGAPGSGTVTSVGLSAPFEFITTGSPVTAAGTLGLDWANPTLIAHGGTGIGEFLASAVVLSGPTSTAPLRSVALTNLSSGFLNAAGAFATPPAQSIQPGTSSTFLSGTGIFTVPLSGGRYLGTTVLTSGTSFTTGASTNRLKLRLVGAGAGGGGVTSAVGAGGAGGGGAAGSYAERVFAVSPNTAYTYAIGAAGTAGANTGGTGGTGGNTTFAVGATTVTCPGGLGGVGQVAGTSTVFVAGGAAGAVSTNGDLNSAGAPGENAVRVSSLEVSAGNGGSSQFGAGGIGAIAPGAGATATGFGAGGSGGVVENNSGAAAGGVGSAGVIVVEEFS